MKRDNDYSLIEQECGKDVARALLEKMAGMRLYIPANILERAHKRRYIVTHFNGMNHRELAKKTGYSIRWVYQLLRSMRRPVANL